MIRDKISAAYKQAMLDKNHERVNAVRMIMSALKDKDIAARTMPGKEEGLSDQEIMAMLMGMIKQRQESIAMYEKGNRKDLADKENGEIMVIREFLPEMMSPAEVEKAVADVIAKTGAASVKDMGKVMGQLKVQYSGRMDLSAVGGVIKAKLGG